MSREELRRAIERPAERVGLSVDPELVEALLTDVEGQPGALPLLSTALLELWRQRDGRRLRLVAYARSGGVQGAVARLAEDAFVRLDPVQQVQARKLLLRLTDEDDSGAIVRRRIPLAELEAERSAEVADVVAQLTDRRLLTVSDGAVEVAHEALLREWPLLRTWLDEDVQGRRLHRRLSKAARAWDADGRDPGGLYRSARLAAALEWAADRDPELTATERAFLDDSRSASGRAQRRLRMVLAGVTSLLVFAVIAGLVALDQRGKARAEATAAAAQRLGAEALAEDEVDRALLLARQGVALHDSPQTRANLLETLLKSPAAIGVLRGDGDRVTALDLSPNNRMLAFVDADGTLNRIDTGTRRPSVQPLTVPDHHVIYGPDDVRFSNDGSRLAVGGLEPRILDARAHFLLTSLRIRSDRVVYSMRFSPDGRTLFAVVSDFSGRSLAQRFDTLTGNPLGEPRFIARTGKAVTLIVTSDGRRVVTGFEGGPIAIRDARTLRPLRKFSLGAVAAALSPDDRTLLVGAGVGSVRFLDLVTGRARTASGRHDGAVEAAAFSADGRTAVTVGEDSRRDRLGRRSSRGRRDARGPLRGDHGGRDQPRRPDALHRRPRRQGADLGSRRRPPPRPPVRHRARHSGRALHGSPDREPCAQLRRPGARRGPPRRNRHPDRCANAAPAHEVSRGPERPGPRHRVLAGRQPARGRRRGRLPRAGRRAPWRSRQTAARPHRAGVRTELQRRRAADGHGRPRRSAAVDAAIRRAGRSATTPRLPPAGYLRRDASPAHRGRHPDVGVEILDAPALQPRATPPPLGRPGAWASRPTGAISVSAGPTARRSCGPPRRGDPSPASSRAHQRGAFAVLEPGRPHAGHGQHRRDDPPVRRGHPAAARRPTAGRTEPIGLEQVTTQPSLVAAMVEALALRGEERVLEVGTGLAGRRAAARERDPVSRAPMSGTRTSRRRSSGVGTPAATTTRCAATGPELAADAGLGRQAWRQRGDG